MYQSQQQPLRSVFLMGMRVAALELTSPCQDSPHLLRLQMPAGAAAYAHRLYAALHRAATVYCPAQIQPQEKTHEEIS
jgi:hypothetical protein